MSQYKYPVKYFCGAGARIYPPKIFDEKVQFIEKRLPISAPITGETGIDGVLLDFNCGLRLQIPEGNWHVKIVDAESEYVFLDKDVSAVTLISLERFLIEWEIALWLDGEPIFYHRFDPTGQRVHFLFTGTALGDNISLLPYVEAFRKKFECTVSCSIHKSFHGIMKNYYPNVELKSALPDDSYACFYMQMISNLTFMATEDSMVIPMLRAGYTFLPCIPSAPKINYTPTKPRSIKEKYVCIGVQASMTAKGWLNPNGWDAVVEHLKSLGYRVLCIDRDRKFSDEFNTIEQPRGAEDFSGSYTLIDRVNQLAYADFFVGLSSGLAWLAWAVGTPVVMISGITERWYEFDTPYRVNNPLVCHGCLNVLRKPEQLSKCPLFKGTERAFECSKNISARQVIDAIERLIEDKNLSGVKNIDSSD